MSAGRRITELAGVQPRRDGVEIDRQTDGCVWHGHDPDRGGDKATQNGRRALLGVGLALNAQHGTFAGFGGGAFFGPAALAASGNEHRA